MIDGKVLLAKIIAVRARLREAIKAVNSPILEDALAEAAAFNYGQNEVIEAEYLLEQVKRIEKDAATGKLDS